MKTQKIVVELNKKSIKEAITKLNSIKAKRQRFMEAIADWIIKQANMHLNNSDIGVNVKKAIESSWSKNITANGIEIINTCPHAVFVEFGVGAVGAKQSHPKADKQTEQSYEYNLPSIHKYAGKHHDDDTWRFTKPSTKDVDLQDGYYEEWPWGSGQVKIITRGSPAVMFAYNAIVDAQVEMSKVDGGKIGEKYYEIFGWR